jgi:hypothetical protein
MARLPLFLLAVILAAGSFVGTRAFGLAQPPGADPYFRNVQVLKGIPPDQMMPVMHMIRTSLGVTCDYCHVAERNQYYRDDKPAKARARQMIAMVLDINRRNFDGRPVVTCNTCHRGSVSPASSPPIGQAAFADTANAAPQPAGSALPGAGQIAQHYIDAIGGRAALERLSTRTSRMTLLRASTVDAQAAPPRVINRGENVRVETVQQAPDRFVRTLTTPTGIIRQILIGERGWVVTPQGTTALPSSEVRRLSSAWELNVDLRRELRLQAELAAAEVRGIEAVGGRPAYVLELLKDEGRTRQRYYFDVASGLLVRRLVLTQTPLGYDPEQTDYGNYRNVGGIRVPFSVRISYLDDNHLGTTRTYSMVRDNAALAPHAFDEPRGP